MEAKSIIQVSKADLEPVLEKIYIGVRQSFLNVLDVAKARHNGYTQLSMATPKKSRTLTQNAKYWAMCSELGVYLGGMTKGEVHEGIKERASEERGYPVYESMITHKLKPISSAKVSTVEFSLLIDMLYQVAAENGYIFSEDL